jgi:hypothetical protein
MNRAIPLIGMENFMNTKRIFISLTLILILGLSLSCMDPGRSLIRQRVDSYYGYNIPGIKSLLIKGDGVLYYEDREIAYEFNELLSFDGKYRRDLKIGEEVITEIYDGEEAVEFRDSGKREMTADEVTALRQLHWTETAAFLYPLELPGVTLKDQGNFTVQAISNDGLTAQVKFDPASGTLVEVTTNRLDLGTGLTRLFRIQFIGGGEIDGIKISRNWVIFWGAKLTARQKIKSIETNIHDIERYFAIRNDDIRK